MSGAQVVHALLPSTDEKLAPTQDWQAPELFAAVARENLPAWQDTHAVERCWSAYFPGVHAVQALEAAAEKYPWLQLVQAEASCLEYVPAGQSRHCVPYWSEYLASVQEVQKDDPAMDIFPGLHGVQADAPLPE